MEWQCRGEMGRCDEFFELGKSPWWGKARQSMLDNWPSGARPFPFKLGKLNSVFSDDFSPTGDNAGRPSIEPRSKERNDSRGSLAGEYIDTGEGEETWTVTEGSPVSRSSNRGLRDSSR